MKNKFIEELNKLRKEKNAIILVHNYQLPEIQDSADVLGDSLDLSKKAKETNKDIIVFCGVRFMAETAKILSPQKTVLLPVYHAGCPMADMVSARDLQQFKKEHPDYKIACYVNTSAEVKAECDVCVTSANAVRVLSRYPYDKFLFIPDKNLGHYVKEQIKEKEIKLWPGYCHVHVRFPINEINQARKKLPKALLLVHPECEPDIVRIADHVLSTNQMITFIKESSHKEFLIGTEEGIIYRLKKENPGKKIYPASRSLVCPNMKKTRLNDVLTALKYNQYEITLPKEIIIQAQKSLEAMLKYS